MCWGVKKLDTSAFAVIIDSMFRKIKNYIMKLFNKDYDSELNYIYYTDNNVQKINKTNGEI